MNTPSDEPFSFDLARALNVTIDAVTRQFWDPNGRTSRRDFWLFLIVIVGALMALSVLSIIPLLGLIFALSLFLASLALIAPTAGMFIRRMHDIGKPWFFALIPLYNLYLALGPGDATPNVYGPVPAR